jgi:hypothetical protein
MMELVVGSVVVLGVVVGAVVGAVVWLRRGAESPDSRAILADFSDEPPPRSPTAAPAAAPEPDVAPTPSSVAPEEAPPTAPPPPEPLAPPEPDAETELAPSEDAHLPKHIEKIRVPDVGLLAYAHIVEDVEPGPLLAFSTDGFAAKGRPELAMYLRRSDVSEADVVPALKRFTAVALKLFEREDTVEIGEVLSLPGAYGRVAVGGFVALDAPTSAGGPVRVLLGLGRGSPLEEAAAAVPSGAFVTQGA